jgi:hypothetical protein
MPGPHRRTNIDGPPFTYYEQLVEQIQVCIGSSALIEDARELIEHTRLKFVIGSRLWFDSPLMFMESTEEPWAPIWTCEYCRAVFAATASCPGCGSHQLKAELHAITNRSTAGYALRFHFGEKSRHPYIATQEAFYVQTEWMGSHTRQARADLSVTVCLIGGHRRRTQ